MPCGHTMDGQPQLFTTPHSFHSLQAQNQGQDQETHPCWESQVTLQPVGFQSWHIMKDVLPAARVSLISLARQHVPSQHCSSADVGRTDRGDFLFPFKHCCASACSTCHPSLTPSGTVFPGDGVASPWSCPRTAALHPALLCVPQPS